jgi:hypothetical protein
MAGAGGALASGCGKAADRAAAPAPSSARPAAAPSVRPAQASVPETRACSLLTAEEVGAIFGKKLESSESGPACEYGLAPNRANPLEQLLVKLEVSLDSRSEAQVKSRYAGLGKDVRLAVHPEKRGMPDTIAVGDDIPGVGDWAFAVNVAAVNLGMGFSSRGRILEAQQGPVHLVVGATIAPDPGTKGLDPSLAAVAKTAFSRLSHDAGTKKSEK